MDAVLSIKLSVNSINDNHILRGSLSVYLVDQNNDMTSQSLVDQQTTVRRILNTDNQEFDDIFYGISLGSYIESLLTTEQASDGA